MRFSKLLTNRHSSLLVTIVAVSILSIGCGGTETTVAVEPISSVTLSWQAPTTNEDNTPLTDLAGYRVYYGEHSGVYSNVVTVGNFMSASLGSMPTGKTIYFAVTAYDTSGNESAPSDEVSMDF